jgi:hypothetical protein
MTPQNSLRVNVVCIIIAPAYMISRNQDIIKILQELRLPLRNRQNKTQKTKSSKLSQ